MVALQGATPILSGTPTPSGFDLSSAVQWAQLIVAVFTGAGVIIALAAIFSQGRAARFSATVENLWRFDDQLHGPDMCRERVAAAKALDAGKHVPEIVDVLNFFEFVGLMVRKGALDTDAANSNFGYWAIRYWYQCQRRIAEDRVTDPTSWKDFERLKDACEKLEAKHHRIHKDRVQLSADDLKGFLREEQSLKAGRAMTKKPTFVGIAGWTAGIAMLLAVLLWLESQSKR
jgi:hypothetical protein